MYNTDNPVRTWDMETYDSEVFDDFWQTVNALAEGSVIASGFRDDGLVYLERKADDWHVVQIDNPNTEDMIEHGSINGDAAVIDCGGDIELAYIIKEVPFQ